MAESFEQFREQILASESVAACRKPPLPVCGEDQNYLFISYAHADYKAVYCDLLRLYENRVRFWYDEGIDLGPVHWSDAAREKMADEHCAGVIFYVSAAAFMSPSVMKEIEWVQEMREKNEGQGKNFFAIYLGSSSAERILFEELPLQFSYDERKAKGLDGKKMSFLFSFFEGTGLSREAAPESEVHMPRLLEQIGKQFNVMDQGGVTDEFFAADHEGNIRDGYAEVTYRDGYVYKGFWKDYQREGEGRLYNKDGELLYEGSWKHGKTCGRGKKYYPASDRRAFYEGEFLDGAYHGQGRLEKKDGTCYRGGYENGKREGYGVQTYTGKLVRYEGYWKDDDFFGQGILYRAEGKQTEGIWEKGLLEDGEGVVIYKDDSVFEGRLEGGKRVGHGRLTFSEKSDKLDYEGDWAEDKRSGQGILRYKNGAVYEGGFLANELDGQGTYTYPESDSRLDYVGEYRNGRRCGKGVLRFRNGCVYDGEWKDDLADGFGIRTYPESSSFVRYEGFLKEDYWEGEGFVQYRDGASYRGTFVHGNKEGSGVYIYPEKSRYDRYEGAFANNGREGEGTLFYKNGKTLAGIFHEDKFADGCGYEAYKDGAWYEGEIAGGLREGRGKMVYKSGDVYEGEFAGGDLSGRGKYTCAGGAWYEGEFAKNKYHGHGVMHYAEKDSKNRILYDGEWEQNERSGEGFELIRYGSKGVIRREGTWAKGKRCGFGRDLMVAEFNGTENEPPRLFYEGDFKNDLRDGRGVSYESGRRFEGEFSKGYMAEGTLIYDNGQTWKGTFKTGVYNNRICDGYGYQPKPALRGEKFAGLGYSGEWYYIGEWKDGLMDGAGTLFYDNGKCLSGQFEKGAVREGSGYLPVKLKGKKPGAYVTQTYEGELAGGLYEGAGKLTLSDGRVLTGQFHEGNVHGKARMDFTDGTYFDGTFVNGQACGTAVMTMANGDVYQGEFSEGKRSGRGVLTRKNGYIYEGEFVNGAFVSGEIRGIERDGGGRVLVEGDSVINPAQWKSVGIEDLRLVKNAATGAEEVICSYTGGISVYLHGSLQKVGSSRTQGVLRTAGGLAYEGGFVSIIAFDGKGTMYFPTGERYEGNWKFTEAVGKGTMTYADGTVRKGAADCGLWKYESGNSFDGLWIGEDALCGWGIFTYKDGEAEEGIFLDGTLVQPMEIPPMLLHKEKNNP